MKWLLILLAVAVAGGAQAAPLRAVGIENEYADVIRQIGGPDVQVFAIVSDPNTDPHTFEVSPTVASDLAGADLVVENGLGYDGWAARLLAASPSARRRVIDVQRLLGLPNSTPNPHVWYDPGTMPKVARAVAADLSALLPADAPKFRTNLAAFDQALDRWGEAVSAFRARYHGTAVAVTEPVADDLLEAAGCAIRTPQGLQVAIMNGTDPAPQEVTSENDLLREHKVAALLYNRQVTDSLTQSFLDLARKNGVPVVGVYETMPQPGFDYQSWMMAETNALTRAVAHRVSTETLRP